MEEDLAHVYLEAMKNMYNCEEQLSNKKQRWHMGRGKKTFGSYSAFFQNNLWSFCCCADAHAASSKLVPW